MPIRNGRLYIDKEKDEGISIREVARCIGVGSEDLGTLMSHRNNNMWSRKKGVVINAKVVDYDLPEWWKGSEGNCGIAAPTRVATLLQVYAQYDGKLNGWRHVLPHTNYRILDYNGYYHYAKPPITGMDAQEQYYKLEDAPIQASIAYNENDIDETGSGSLQMSDIKIDNIPLDQWYVGVAILSEDGTNVVGRVATQSGENIETISFPSTGLVESYSYILMPFYSKTPIGINEGDSGDWDLMAIPLVKPVTFKLESPSKMISVGVDAEWSGDKSSITVTVYAENKSVSAFDFTDTSAVVKLRFEGMGFEDGMAAGEYEVNIASDIGVLYPRQPKVVIKVQNIPSEYRTKTYYAWVRLYTAGINFNAGPEIVIDNTENQ